MITLYRLALATVLLFSFKAHSQMTDEQIDALKGTVPADALQTLKELPERAITLELVITKAMSSADSFKQILSDLAAADAPMKASRAPFDIQWGASALNYDATLDTTSAFSPEKIKKQTISTSIGKQFTTGTGLKLEYEESYTDNDYAAAASAFITTQEYYDGKGTITLSQDLWKNSFGRANRRSVKAGELESERLKLLIRGGVHEWTIGLAGIFYRAWFSQRNAKAMRTNLARQERLLKINRIKRKRGTAERSDLLQTEAAVISAQQSVNKADQDLDDLWRYLVSTLKFPVSWFGIDPIIVPMLLDNPIPKAQALCTTEPLKSVPKSSVTIEALTKQQKSSQFNFEAAKDGLRPTLQLQLVYGSEALDADKSEASSQLSSGDFPATTGLLVFQLPLSNDGAKAQAMQAYANKEKAHYQLAGEKAALEVDWVNACTNLDRLVKQTQQNRIALEKQNERARLDERRFKIGQVPADIAIRSGLESVGAGLTVDSSVLESRLAAWEVYKLSGEIQNFIENLAKKNSIEVRFKKP